MEEEVGRREFGRVGCGKSWVTLVPENTGEGNTRAPELGEAELSQGRATHPAPENGDCDKGKGEREKAELNRGGEESKYEQGQKWLGNEGAWTGTRRDATCKSS